jgi:hypothetical protein
MQISLLFLSELSDIPCIFSHFDFIGNVQSLDIQYHSWSINSILVSINMTFIVHVL